MKIAIIIVVILSCVGCSNRGDIVLNDINMNFDSFEDTDSLSFVGFYNDILDEPSKMLLKEDYLIMEGFNSANGDFISIFSLKSNELIKTCIPKGSGHNEMISCTASLLNNNLWLYDMSKFRVGNISIDNLLNNSANIVQHNRLKYYYDIAMLNDTIMLGTNDLSVNKKISFVDIKNGDVTFAGDYSYLNEKIELGALMDVCSCYIDVNPVSKAISLAYRYTDVVEIYNFKGQLEYSLHGPEGFDIELTVRGSEARKDRDKTRKTFVNTYVTSDFIYLLYSGYTPDDDNWSYGTEIFVYSWCGKPVKRYILDQPIYTFSIDEKRGYIYSYSIETDELVKAYLL